MTKRKWTKTSVVRAIRAWHRQGGLLSTVWKEDSSLHSGAAACFGTWRKALEAAGFPCARRIWSPELVLAAIRDRHQRQLSLSGVQRDDRFLFAAACRHFGGWHNALAAAGLSLERPRKWTPERVLDAIRGWQREGRPLTSVRQTDKPLYAAAARLFGTWLNAVLAAGLPMKQLRRWTKEDVLAAIHEARARGLTTAEISTQNPSLCGAAKRHFGGWRGAMVAAGVPVEMPRRWNRATVIAAIQAHSRSGFALSQVWRRDKPLFRAATRWFGNWEHALSAAGLPGKIRRRWSQTRVIQELRAWYPQPQPNLRRVDPALANAASRLFGDLATAWEAAGLKPSPHRWPPQRVIAAIQDGYVRGLPIALAGFGNVPLAGAAKRRFGSWADAVAAAGLASRLPVAKPARAWSQEAVLQAIRTQHEQSRNTTVVWKQDTGLYSAAKKHFGSWRQAIIAAGFEPAREAWTAERIVRRIRGWHDQGVPVRSQQNPRLTAAAIRLFGSWRNAVVAAGIDGHSTERDDTWMGEKDRESEPGHASRHVNVQEQTEDV